MTLDERIEKAFQAISGAVVGDSDEVDFWRDETARAIRAAFPELFSDPPTHKIVPLEPTEEIAIAGLGNGWNVGNQ